MKLFKGLSVMGLLLASGQGMAATLKTSDVYFTAQASCAASIEVQGTLPGDQAKGSSLNPISLNASIAAADNQLDVSGSASLIVDSSCPYTISIGSMTLSEPTEFGIISNTVSVSPSLANLATVSDLSDTSDDIAVPSLSGDIHTIYIIEHAAINGSRGFSNRVLSGLVAVTVVEL